MGMLKAIDNFIDSRKISKYLIERSNLLNNLSIIININYRYFDQNNDYIISNIPSQFYEIINNEDFFRDEEENYKYYYTYLIAGIIFSNLLKHQTLRTKILESDIDNGIIKSIHYLYSDNNIDESYRYIFADTLLELGCHEFVYGDNIETPK